MRKTRQKGVGSVSLGFAGGYLPEADMMFHPGFLNKVLGC